MKTRQSLQASNYVVVFYQISNFTVKRSSCPPPLDICGHLLSFIVFHFYQINLFDNPQGLYEYWANID